MLRLLLNICFIFILVSCRLTPVYNKHLHGSNISSLNSIRLNPINSIEGAEFYNTFSHLFPLTQPEKYLLNVSLSVISSPQIIETNSNVFRTVSIYKVSYELIDISGLKVLTSGNFNLRNSYNNFLPAYTSYLEYDHLNMILARNAAKEVRNRLILYFYHRTNDTQQ